MGEAKRRAAMEAKAGPDLRLAQAQTELLHVLNNADPARCETAIGRLYGDGAVYTNADILTILAQLMLGVLRDLSPDERQSVLLVHALYVDAALFVHDKTANVDTTTAH